jgi:hypothetical protein
MQQVSHSLKRSSEGKAEALKSHWTSSCLFASHSPRSATYMSVTPNPECLDLTVWIKLSQAHNLCITLQFSPYTSVSDNATLSTHQHSRDRSCCTSPPTHSSLLSFNPSLPNSTRSRFTLPKPPTSSVASFLLNAHLNVIFAASVGFYSTFPPCAS